MNYSALFRSALVALLRNKMRSVLTVLGITIGIAAVICVVAIGKAGPLGCVLSGLVRRFTRTLPRKQHLSRFGSKLLPRLRPDCPARPIVVCSATMRHN